MADFTVKFNTQAILSAVTAAHNTAAITLDIELRKAITSSVWAWPRGESPRDIVLTGKLRNSQKMVRLSGTKTQWKWGVKYALYVRNGVVLRNGAVLPARKWDELAIKNTDVPKVFADSFKVNYRG